MMYDIGVKLLERTKNDRGGRNPYIFAAAVVYASERKLAKIQKRSTTNFILFLLFSTGL